MPLIRITRQGLCSIAVLTSILWGCILVERRTLARARADADQALHEIRLLRLKKPVLPASTPAPARAPSRSIAG